MRGGKGVVWRVYKLKSTSQYRNLRVDFDIGLSIVVVQFFQLALFNLCLLNHIVDIMYLIDLHYWCEVYVQ
jgi:hypothetical protein